jgi:hypothetical protein
MTLPQFQNIPYQPYQTNNALSALANLNSNMAMQNSVLNPIYKNRFEIEFDDEYMNHNCTKIDEKYIHFCLNEKDGSIIPLHKIHQIIENKSILNIPISIFNKQGETITIIYLENTIFTKIKDLINFDYGNQSPSISKIKVRYKYDKMKIFKNSQQLFLYKRKQKLIKINNI